MPRSVANMKLSKGNLPNMAALLSWQQMMVRQTAYRHANKRGSCNQRAARSQCVCDAAYSIKLTEMLRQRAIGILREFRLHL